MSTLNAKESTKTSRTTVTTGSQSNSVVSTAEYEDPSVTPEFIYGGPFIPPKKSEPFVDAVTPINLPLQGTFKRSFAYYSLKERMPVILTKVIDQLSRRGDEDSKNFVQNTSKLKSDLITNKRYTPLEADSKDAKRWNRWIEDTDNHYYFNNTWLFTECYVYRKLWDFCEISKSLQDFDPFAEQKEKAFSDTLELMCLVAEELNGMLAKSENKTNEFSKLMKLCLWANKCDLSLSVGEPVMLKASKSFVDPIKMVDDLKDKLLVDDLGKFTLEPSKSAKVLDPNEPKLKCSCHRLAAQAGEAIYKKEDNVGGAVASPPGAPPAPGAPHAPAAGSEGADEVPKIPCPAKVVEPCITMYDIVCDNAGYELFMDLCVADFILTNNLAQRVRFHVKKIPWFVSDVTPRDFNYVLFSCLNASYNRQVSVEPKTDQAEGEAPAARVISAEELKTAAARWNKHFQDKAIVVMCDEFWTSPHPFKDMKKYDYNLYRKLQFASAIIFKGDLNYRKLLADVNWNPVTPFEKALQGFNPAPIIALRTVKADLICGLGKGKWEQLNEKDPGWMLTGNYGMIQYCKKKEPLKVSEKPCLDYGETCFGEVCPQHEDLW